MKRNTAEPSVKSTVVHNAAQSDNASTSPDDTQAISAVSADSKAAVVDDTLSVAGVMTLLIEDYLGRRHRGEPVSIER